jgi:hypothetical protein
MTGIQSSIKSKILSSHWIGYSTKSSLKNPKKFDFQSNFLAIKFYWIIEFDFKNLLKKSNPMVQ